MKFLHQFADYKRVTNSVWEVISEKSEIISS